MRKQQDVRKDPQSTEETKLVAEESKSCCTALYSFFSDCMEKVSAPSEPMSDEQFLRIASMM